MKKEFFLSILFLTAISFLSGDLVKLKNGSYEDHNDVELVLCVCYARVGECSLEDFLKSVFSECDETSEGLFYNVTKSAVVTTPSGWSLQSPYEENGLDYDIPHWGTAY